MPFRPGPFELRHLPVPANPTEESEHEQEYEYEQRSANALHMLDNVVAELTALDLGGAFHQSSEIVGDAFARDGAV
jgi:hypothetical protein